MCEQGGGELGKWGEEGADLVGVPAESVDLVGEAGGRHDGGVGGGLVLRG